jgi:hypothetical protein
VLCGVLYNSYNCTGKIWILTKFVPNNDFLYRHGYWIVYKITNIIMCCLYRLMSNILGSDISTQGSRPAVEGRGLTAYSGQEWTKPTMQLRQSNIKRLQVSQWKMSSENVENKTTDQCCVVYCFILIIVLSS